MNVERPRKINSGCVHHESRRMVSPAARCLDDTFAYDIGPHQGWVGEGMLVHPYIGGAASVQAHCISSQEEVDAIERPALQVHRFPFVGACPTLTLVLVLELQD